MSLDYAVHSDFLIHWTGKDLDKRYDPNWASARRSGTETPKLQDEYLKRLADTLRYGFWLTETDESPVRFKAGAGTSVIPSTPKVCFTELKLSESLRHARHYGRLGIGMKRKYLFDRSGRPCAYFGFHEVHHRDEFLIQCAADLKDKTLLNFFKPMNSTPNNLNYDLYSESEWRILFMERLLKAGLLIDPRDPKNTKHYEFYNSLSSDQQKILRYLAPLDGWFSMIIYPSLSAKNASQRDNAYHIQDLIESIKSLNDHANAVEGRNWPIEVNLDACRHF
jgi:hypothetical protein